MNETMEHDRHHGPCQRFSPLAIVGMVVGGLALAVILAFAFGWIVMLLWNRLMPSIFGLPAIGFWQAWGLVVLSHILIKPGYGPLGHHGHHGRHGGMRPFRHGPCGKDSSWREEMKKHFSDEAKAEE